MKSKLRSIIPLFAACAMVAAILAAAPPARAADLTYTDLPATGDSELILQHKALTAAASNKFLQITTATTTAVKAGSGIVEKILITTVGSSSTATVYDNTAGSGTVIATINTDSLGTYHFGCRFATGLTIVTVGTPKITVVYR